MVLASKKNSPTLVGLLLIQTRVSKSEKTMLCGVEQDCSCARVGQKVTDSDLFYNVFLPSPQEQVSKYE